MSAQPSRVREHFLPAVLHASMSFAVSSYVAADVQAFVAKVPAGWGLGHLTDVVKALTNELAGWTTTHNPSDVFTVMLTWDDPILHVEVSDRGVVAPDLNASRTDAEFAVRLLTIPVVEWGADLDSRGRCLWATLHGGSGDDDHYISSGEHSAEGAAS